MATALVGMSRPQRDSDRGNGSGRADQRTELDSWLCHLLPHGAGQAPYSPWVSTAPSLDLHLD